jgi:pyridoxal phosphate enzyme (YggS family)
MSVNLTQYQKIQKECATANALLVAVSKIKPVSDIKALYDAGQRDFGENYVQELVDKQTQLPEDIRWHFIGHLQSNKVKFIVPFVYLIHGVDSLKLLKEISKQGVKLNRRVNCLLQVHIAQEETKFGLDEKELQELVESVSTHPEVFAGIQIRGLMGMASFTENEAQIRQEFRQLTGWANKYLPAILPDDSSKILSFGMSGDYTIALEEGSTLVRIGSLLFGARN